MSDEPTRHNRRDFPHTHRAVTKLNDEVWQTLCGRRMKHSIVTSPDQPTCKDCLRRIAGAMHKTSDLDKFLDIFAGAKVDYVVADGKITLKVRQGSDIVFEFSEDGVLKNVQVV